MVNCHAKTEEGKRCKLPSVEGQVFCAVHLKAKSRMGKSRHIGPKRCKRFAKSHKSPFSKKHLGKKSVLRRHIKGACKAHKKH